MKKLLSLFLSLIIIFSLAAPVRAAEKVINLKVGEEKVVDMSKYISLLIDTLNHDDTISKLLDPVTKIQNLVNKIKKVEE